MAKPLIHPHLGFFPACAKSLNTSLLLSPSSSGDGEQTCPGSSISFSHRCPFDVDSELQCILYVFEGSASTIQPGLKFPILQVLQCDNPGASYALYIFSIKECRKLQVECGKSHRFKVHIDTNSVQDSRVWDENALVISRISESARHLYSEGGKYPNKQSRITFDYAAMRQI